MCKHPLHAALNVVAATSTRCAAAHHRQRLVKSKLFSTNCRVQMGRKRQRNRSDAVKARPENADGHRIHVATLKSAVSALVANAIAVETKRNEKLIQAGENVEQLLLPEGFLHLVVTFKFPPFKPKLRPSPIALKHSLWKEGQTEVCLIVKDPQRLVKDYLAQHGNGGVTRVLGVEKIRKRYGTHEGRREFSTMYDVYLVDNRVAPMMPNLLGNAFLQAKLMPLAVDMRKDVVASIQRTLKSSPFSPRQGTCTSLKVGRIDFSADQLVENVLMAADGVARRCEGGWNNIQSLSLKTCRSPAVQIYLSLPGGNAAAGKSASDSDVQIAKKAKVDAK